MKLTESLWCLFMEFLSLAEIFGAETDARLLATCGES